MEKKIVYIAHPISGNTESNLVKLKRIIRELNLTRNDIVPFAHYFVDCHCLDDSVPAERERGIANDIELFNRGFIDELWLYGDKISKGMLAEMELCFKLKIQIEVKSRLGFKSISEARSHVREYLIGLFEKIRKENNE